MLYTPNMIEGWMKKYILFEKMGETYPECSAGIEILTGYHKVLHPENLYVGTSEEVYLALTTKIKPHQELVILSSGTSTELESLKLPLGITLMCFNLDLITLYNKVHHYVHEFFSWDREIERAMYTNNSLQALLDQANIHMKTSMAILNAGYRVLAFSRNEEIVEPILDPMCESGMMNYEMVKTITLNLADQGMDLSSQDEVEYLAPHSGYYSFIWNITYNDKIVGRFIMILKQTEPSPFYRDFGRVIREHITEFFTNDHAVHFSQNEMIGNLVTDIIEGRITSETVLNERLKPLEFAFSNYYHLLIVHFPDVFAPNANRVAGAAHINLPWNYVISQFEQVFPFSNIITYKNELIILHRKSTYSPTLTLKNETAVLKLLKQYNGYIMLGNCSKFIFSMGSLYYITQDAFRLAREMNSDNDVRIFSYEDYSLYQTIEAAVTGLMTKNGMSNPVYLCPPALINLYRYDKKNGTDFCHILRTYLNCDRNASETARILYMHRNTMLYNISKIESILGESLDNVRLKARLFFGFYVIDYVEKYLKDELTRLKPNHLKESNNKK